MQKFMSELQIKMEGDLKIIGLEQDPVRCYRQSLEKVKETFVELGAFLNDNQFSGEEEEICYYKEWAPLFYGRLFFFRQACKATLFQDIFEAWESYQMLKNEQKSILSFLRKNKEFSNYYDHKHTEQDNGYFTRGGSNRMSRHMLYLALDTDFSIGTFKIAQIMANRMYLDLVNEQLDERFVPSYKGALRNPCHLITEENEVLIKIVYGESILALLKRYTYSQLILWLSIDIGDTKSRFC